MTLNQKIGIIIYILLIIECAVISTAIFLNVRKTPALYRLILCHIDMLLWLIFAIIENMAIDTPYLVNAIRLTLIPMFFLGALWLDFTLTYTGVITKKSILNYLIFVPPIVCSLPLLFDQLLYLDIIQVTAERNIYDWGLLLIINTAISYIYVFISVAILIHKFVKEQTNSKKRTYLLLTSVLFPVFLNIAMGTQVIPSPGFDITPLSFAVFFGVITIFVFKYKFMDLTAVAAYELFTNINEAVFIIGKNGEIIFPASCILVQILCGIDICTWYVLSYLCLSCKDLLDFLS